MSNEQPDEELQTECMGNEQPDEELQTECMGNEQPDEGSITDYKEEIITISKNGYIMIMQILFLILFIISLISLLAKPESISALVWIFISIVLMMISSVIKND